MASSSQWLKQWTTSTQAASSQTRTFRPLYLPMLTLNPSKLRPTDLS